MLEKEINLSESTFTFYEKPPDLKTEEIEEHYSNHGFISKEESKQRILICNIAFNTCLQIVTIFLVILHASYHDSLPIMVPYHLSKFFSMDK